MENVIKNYNEQVTLEDVERQYILKCIEHFDGNRSKAAQKLKISRTTLYRKVVGSPEQINKTQEQ